MGKGQVNIKVIHQAFTQDPVVACEEKATTTGCCQVLTILINTTTTRTTTLNSLFDDCHLLFCHQIWSSGDGTVRFEDKPEFPGSRSRYIHKLEFIDPDSQEGIPVYRVLNREGRIIDESQNPKVCCIIFIVIFRTFVAGMAVLPTADLFLDFSRQKKSCSIVLLEKSLPFKPVLNLIRKTDDNWRNCALFKKESL